MSWSAQVYAESLRGFGDFNLRENDYVCNSRKFGGNSLAITQGRWIHHTSFIWDYDLKNMEYLKLPVRAPNYRSGRSHIDFLCRMKEYVPSRSTFIERTINALGKYFSVSPFQLEEMASIPNTFNGFTKPLTKQDLEDAYPSVFNLK